MMALRMPSMLAPLLLAPLLLAALVCAPAYAQQAYPGKPIRLILPFPPGAPSDMVGRTIGQKIGEQMGQNFVPDNRAGAGVPGYEATTWYPVLVPAGTPRATVERLHAELVAIVRTRDVHERFSALGMEPIGSTPAELAAHIRRELPKWAKVVQASGARID